MINKLEQIIKELEMKGVGEMKEACNCEEIYNCCDCGGEDEEYGCGCRYCWSCNACDDCIEQREKEF